MIFFSIFLEWNIRERTNKGSMRSYFFGVFFVLLLLCGCRLNLRDKTHHCGTTPISDSLFVETYLIWTGGATNGDYVSLFITDSTTFRKYITTVGDHYWPDIAVKGDSIIVYLNTYCTPRDSTIIFSLKDLKQKGVWE